MSHYFKKIHTLIQIFCELCFLIQKKVFSYITLFLTFLRELTKSYALWFGSSTWINRIRNVAFRFFHRFEHKSYKIIQILMRQYVVVTKQTVINLICFLMQHNLLDLIRTKEKLVPSVVETNFLVSINYIWKIHALLINSSKFYIFKSNESNQPLPSVTGIITCFGYADSLVHMF